MKSKRQRPVSPGARCVLLDVEGKSVESSGGKTRLGRISRRGDAYLRSLLVQGAKSALQAALRQPPEKANRLQQWIVDVYGRVGYHKTLVAIANKHARMIWAMLAKDEGYDPSAWQRLSR